MKRSRMVAATCAALLLALGAVDAVLADLARHAGNTEAAVMHTLLAVLWSGVAVSIIWRIR